MSIFSYIRSIYALDTIDTRFTSSSSTPYKAVVDARLDPAASSSKRDDSILGAGVKTDRRGRPVAQPSKWNTPEFYFYYFVFLTIVPYMFWITYDVSRRLYPPENQCVRTGADPPSSLRSQLQEIRTVAIRWVGSGSQDCGWNRSSR